MRLTRAQVSQYRRDGYVKLKRVLAADAIAALKEEAGRLVRSAPAGLTKETDTMTARALHGCHLVSAIYRNLANLDRLVVPARQVLGSDVYVYQLKVHFKHPFVGSGWSWHQDYIYWRNEDGMPEPRAANVMVFLDELTEFNGPLVLIERSHVHGVIEVADGGGRDDGADDWRRHVAAELPYSLDAGVVKRLGEAGAMRAPKGPAGTVLMFHPNIAHASGPNLSPCARTTVIVTYNSVENLPARRDKRRPDFLVSRDESPIEAIVTSVVG